MSEQFRMIQGFSVATAKLVEVLKEGPIGRTISADELTKAAERDVRPRGKGYASLRSAIRHVLRVYGLQWGWIRGAGAVKCMDANEINDAVDSHAKHVRRISGVAFRKGAVALSRGDELAPDRRGQLTARVASLGAIRLLSGDDAVKAIQATPPKSQPKLEDLMKVFK